MNRTMSRCVVRCAVRRRRLGPKLCARVRALRQKLSAKRVAEVVGLQLSSVKHILASGQHDGRECLRSRVPAVVNALRRTKGRRRVAAREVAVALGDFHRTSVARVCKEMGLDMRRTNTTVKDRRRKLRKWRGKTAFDGYIPGFSQGWGG